MVHARTSVFAGRVLHLVPCFLLLAVFGCAGEALDLAPPADQGAQARAPRLEGVERVELGIKQPDIGAFKLVVLKEPADLKELLDWLRKVDWSNPGEDTAPIRLPAPDVSLTLHRKDGTKAHFLAYWDGKFVHGGRLRKVDVAGLKKLVQRVSP
jgi:hypothetical protein